MKKCTSQSNHPHFLNDAETAVDICGGTSKRINIFCGRCSLPKKDFSYCEKRCINGCRSRSDWRGVTNLRMHCNNGEKIEHYVPSTYIESFISIIDTHRDIPYKRSPIT